MKKIEKIMKAILIINPSAKVYVNLIENSFDAATIEWLDGTTPISKADIQAEMDKL